MKRTNFPFKTRGMDKVKILYYQCNNNLVCNSGLKYLSRISSDQPNDFTYNLYMSYPINLI